MRNGYAQTTVAPYALRPRPGAPVATPVRWEELGARGMRAGRYTLRAIGRRLTGTEDPWRHLARHARTLTRPGKRLDQMHQELTE